MGRRGERRTLCTSEAGQTDLKPSGSNPGLKRLDMDLGRLRITDWITFNGSDWTVNS
jgi:hypothetical protein